MLLQCSVGCVLSMFYFTYIHPTQSTRLGPNSGWGKSHTPRLVVVVEGLRRVHTRAVMRIECVFDPDPCVHARCALLCLPMRISEATSGGGLVHVMYLGLHLCVRCACLLLSSRRIVDWLSPSLGLVSPQQTLPNFRLNKKDLGTIWGHRTPLSNQNELSKWK